MPDSGKTTDQPEMAELAADLKGRIAGLVDALVAQDEQAYESEFARLFGRVTELVERKLRMEGTKTDTRDFLAELLFTRLRRGMQLFMQGEETVAAQRAAEWVMGVVFPVATLSEFASAFDQSLISSSATTKDFNFAGRTDFLPVEEVIQMLCGGKHLGCLSLVKCDNRLDIYLKEGRIVFLDPHHLIRRVLPGDAMRHRELSETAVTEAESRRAREGVPVLIALGEKGLVRRDEVRELMRTIGKETMFDFMREVDPYAFYFRKLEALPAFAETNDLRLGATSLLLEGSKQLDDWKQMLQVFPDRDAAIEPNPNMFQRLGDVVLGVLELKLLSQINGDMTPRSLVNVLGLPLYEVYQILIKLSREGIIAPVGGSDSLEGVDSSLDDPIQQAFAALDANDDEPQQQSDEDLEEDAPHARGDDAAEDDAAEDNAIEDEVVEEPEPPPARPSFPKAFKRPAASKPAASKPAAKPAAKEDKGGGLLNLLRKGTKG
ncbi:MAG TPA: DUF4388 domain-containing protein [Planctomycetota bacterium]|nr:DUF4388 domain-containing protein [Planctomycetota bacterium]